MVQTLGINCPNGAKQIYNSATKKCFDLGTRSILDKQKEDFYIEGGMQKQNGHKDRRTAPDV